jgi:hypothetical protein
MMRKCKVCTSPHREEYERLRLQEKKTYMELSEIAAKQYNEMIHWNAFRRHMTRHCLPFIEHAVKSSKFREEVIKAQIKKDVLIATQLTEALEICRNKIQEKLKLKDMDESDEKLLLEYIEEARLIIEALLKWSKELKLEQDTSQNIENKIIECMKDFPPDLVQLFLERWKSHGSSQ